MRDLLAAIDAWSSEGEAIALATVIGTWGSSPRPVGSKMVMTASGRMVGSVSGGCVEAAVLDAAKRVLKSGMPRLVEFGVTHEMAWEVGLSCGGRLEVFVEPLCEEMHLRLRDCLSTGELVALATVVGGKEPGKHLLVWPAGSTFGDLGAPGRNQQAALFAEQLLPEMKSGRKVFEWEGEAVEVFFESHAPAPKLVVIGAVHVAVPLVWFADELGLRTVVIDPRAAFATQERFPHADELRVEWPDEALDKVGIDESTCIVALSHDPKIDLPALEKALGSRARYIGALGSKKTHSKRVAALEEAGFDEASISRIHSPIGLDLGGRRAEEIALSIMAEIVAVRHGKSSRNAG